MSEFGGLEIGAPDEGNGKVSEALSEQAKERFAAAAAAMKAIQREEKRSKKRDSRVARTIIQFLGDEKHSHLFVLISRLVARDCPSIFILAILSLISDESESVVREYLLDTGGQAMQTVDDSLRLTQSKEVNAIANQALVQWITRMQMVLSLETVSILTKLLIDERNIDGTVLQLSSFVLQEFFRSQKGGSKEIPFDRIQALAASILQTVFEPFMNAIDRSHFEKPKQDEEEA